MAGPSESVRGDASGHLGQIIQWTLHVVTLSPRGAAAQQPVPVPTAEGRMGEELGGWSWCCTSCDGFSFGIVLLLRRLSNGQRGRRWAMRRLSDKQNRELTRESPTPAARAARGAGAGAAVAFGVLTRVHTQADACTDMHAHAHTQTQTGYTGRVPLHVINAGRAESPPPPKQGRVTKDACLALPEQELAVERRRRRRRRGGALAAVWWLRGGWRLPLAASAGCATRTGHCFGPKLTENLGLLVARFWFSAQTESDCGGRGKLRKG